MTLKEKLSKFNAELPLEKARTIPNDWYLDEEIYALEKEKVFARQWQVLGRVQQLSEPGSFFTEEICAEPLLAVRDKENQVGVFSNVCRHRAALVVPEKDGKLSKLRCRYHGWTYNLCGQLIGTPEFDGVEDFCKENHGLPQWRNEQWGQYLFATRDPNLNSLDTLLTPLKEKTLGLNLESFGFVNRREYELQCNWKVFVDNYLDGGYHINTVHPSLADIVQYTDYRSEVFDHSSVQISPLGTSSSQQSSASEVRAGREAYYWWVFPNLMVNIYQGVMDVNIVYPLGPHKCRVVFDFFFSPEIFAKGEAFTKKSMDVAHQIQLEDVQICEEVQKGLRSQTYTTGRFSKRREEPGYHFHKLLAKILRN